MWKRGLGRSDQWKGARAALKAEIANNVLTGSGIFVLKQAYADTSIVDEATAIFKCTNDPPVGETEFLTYEGLPSDHYLWLVGEGGRLIRGEREPGGALPERR